VPKLIEIGILDIFVNEFAMLIFANFLVFRTKRKIQHFVKTGIYTGVD